MKDYYVALGPKMNLLKSAVYFNSRNIDRCKHALKEILGVIEQTRVLFYLGVPITGWRFWRSECSEMETSIREQLEGW